MAGTITRVKKDGTFTTKVVDPTGLFVPSDKAARIAKAAMEEAQKRGDRHRQLLRASSGALRAALLRG